MLVFWIFVDVITDFLIVFLGILMIDAECPRESDMKQFDAIARSTNGWK